MLDPRFLRSEMDTAAQRPATTGFLPDQGRVRGVTVFGGIACFGKSGVMDTSTPIDMSLHVPAVTEFC